MSELGETNAAVTYRLRNPCLRRNFAAQLRAQNFHDLPKLCLDLVFIVLKALGLIEILDIFSSKRFLWRSKPRRIKHNKLMTCIDGLNLLVLCLRIFQFAVGSCSLCGRNFGIEGFFVFLVCNICQFSS